MHDVNQLNRHTELVCDYLRKCRLVALAVAVRAGEHGDASSRVNPHFCRLIETGARPKLTGEHRRCHCTSLNVRRDTDTAQLSLSRRLLPALFEAGIVRRLQRHFERGEIVAAVVDERHRRLIGVGVLGNEIAAAQLCRVDPHLARRRLDEALDDIAGLRPSGTAISVDWHRVREYALHLNVDGGGRVGSREQRAVAVGRDSRREAGEIGAEVGQCRDAQGEELAILVKRQFGMGEVVASLVVGSEALGTLGCPFHRPAKPAGRPSDQRLLGIERPLSTEAAAHIWRHYPELVLGNRKDGAGDQQSDHMRILAGRVERVVARCTVVFAARGSIGLETSRLLTMSRRVTWCARAKAASTAASSPICQSKQMLLGAFSKSCGLPGLIASSEVTTAGSGLYKTSTSSAASFACSSVSAITTATGSPT